jgi:putative phosphoribosyl transferase
MSFTDRRHAGEVLAEHLSWYAGRPDTIVFGLVRGGVPVAAEVARRLGVPLDVLVVRKLGVPAAPEVAFGALGPLDVRVLNDGIASEIAPETIAAVVRQESAELARRERQYRGGRRDLNLVGHTAIVVDDGLATGASARAAIAAVRRMGAQRVVLALPVGAAQAVAELSRMVDEMICHHVPAKFGAVSRFYDDFEQVEDAQVIAMLADQS